MKKILSLVVTAALSLSMTAVNLNREALELRDLSTINKTGYELATAHEKVIDLDVKSMKKANNIESKAENDSESEWQYIGNASWCENIIFSTFTGVENTAVDEVSIYKLSNYENVYYIEDAYRLLYAELGFNSYSPSLYIDASDPNDVKITLQSIGIKGESDGGYYVFNEGWYASEYGTDIEDDALYCTFASDDNGNCSIIFPYHSCTLYAEGSSKFYYGSNYESVLTFYDPDIAISDYPRVATYIPSEQGYANAEVVTSAYSEGFRFIFDKGTYNYSPTYYNNGEALRFYSNNTLTISAPARGIISSIVFVFSETDGSNPLTANVGSFDGTIWTGLSKSVTFTVGGNSGHRKVYSITVTAVKDDGTVSVETIETDTNEPVKYYNLNGIEVNGNLSPGVYITRQGDKISKTIIR